ncbi:MAG: hypothetical protein ACRDYX_03985 [Egibacteraceae bacterium]
MMRSTPALARTLRASGWLAVVLAVAAIATGCGRAGDPMKRLQGAQRATLGAGSAAFAIEQSFEGASSEVQKIRTEGVLDFARRIGRATVKLADGETEVLFAGDTTYFRLPPNPQVRTPWIRLDRQDIEKVSGLKSVSDDPSRNLDLLNGIVGDVELVGEEDVRGARTTHYRFAIDLRQAAEKASADRREVVQQQAAILGGNRLPSEAWLDAKGRIARQTFTFNLQKSQLPAGTALPDGVSWTARTLIEYYDFGTKVDVKPPPDDQVTDFEAPLGG